MADLQICKTCGNQHSSESIQELKNECPICLDPRQYVPPTGQAWITLTSLRTGKHKNVFHPMDTDQTSTANLIAIRTEPQVAIGQSAYLVRTPEGNVLWDCITYLDDETIEAIKGLGGLKAIAISHPHFFSTHIEYGFITVELIVDGPKRLTVLYTVPLRNKNGSCEKTVQFKIVGRVENNLFSLESLLSK
jgi:hypothetical protein